MTSRDCRRLHADGVVVLPSLLDNEQVACAAIALEEVFASQADIAVDRGWTTATYRVAYALPVRHRFFVDLVAHAPLVALAREVLGDDLVLSAFNGIDLPAGGTPQALHRDHPYATPGLVATVQLVVALDPFRLDTGATRVVRRSHVRPLADAEPSSLEHLAEPVEVEPGGGVAYDGALAHAGGANRSTGPRRALHLFYARPWVRPHWDFETEIDGPLLQPISDAQRSLLGIGRSPRRYDPSTRSVVR